MQFWGKIGVVFHVFLFPLYAIRTIVVPTVSTSVTHYPLVLPGLPPAMQQQQKLITGVTDTWSFQLTNLSSVDQTVSITVKAGSHLWATVIMPDGSYGAVPKRVILSDTIIGPVVVAANSMNHFIKLHGQCTAAACAYQGSSGADASNPIVSQPNDTLPTVPGPAYAAVTTANQVSFVINVTEDSGALIASLIHSHASWLLHDYGRGSATPVLVNGGQPF